MTCQRCQSVRILRVMGCAKDLNSYRLAGRQVQEDGYVVSNAGIGGGDCYNFDLCLDCKPDGTAAEGLEGKGRAPFPSEVLYWGSTFLN